MIDHAFWQEASGYTDLCVYRLSPRDLPCLRPRSEHSHRPSHASYPLLPGPRMLIMIWYWGPHCIVASRNECRCAGWYGWLDRDD